MKKTAVSIFLVLVMCMGLVLPVFAGGEEILSPYMEIEDGMAHQLPLDENASGKGWSYDASTYTLTLNGFEGQYVRVYYAEKPFTMVLADGSSNHFSFGFDVKTNAGFTIKGNGSLDMSGNEFGRFDIGDTLTIESGTITSILKAFLNGGKLHMAGGSLNISGDYYGILGSTYDYTDTCTITGGKITIEGTNSALELLRDITAGDMVTGLENAVFTGKDGSALTLQVTDEGASHFARLYDAGGNVATYAEITASGSSVQPGNTEDNGQSTETVAGFSDVKAAEYYAAPVAWAVEKGITAGTSDTTFSPYETCTRAQIITFLWRAAGSPEPQSAGVFSDVAQDAYYAKATAWAAENGMAEGDTFSPEEPCTRQMAVEFMWKHAGSPDAAAASFTDVSSDAVDWALANGVTSGTSDTTFSPNDTCTRAQIVTFLYRAFA